MATASFEIRGRDCAMLRNTMTSERPLSDTLPHPRGSSLSRRIHEEEEDERRGGRQKEIENRGKSEKRKNCTNQCVVASSISLPLVYMLFIFSLSLSLFPSSLLASSPSFSLFLPDLFVSFAGRMSACPTDEFIFVHAFRLHRQEIYARIAVRGKLLSAAGIIHTSRSLDEELTTGDAFSRLNAEGCAREKNTSAIIFFPFFVILSPFRFCKIVIVCFYKKKKITFRAIVFVDE